MIQPKPQVVKTAQQAQQPAQPKPLQPFIVNTGAFTEEENWGYYLLYGASGAGKTYLASSAQWVPEMQRVIFLNAEAGVKSVVSTDVVRITVPDFHTVNRFYEWSRIYCRYRDAGDEDKMRELCEQVGIPFDYYRTVVIDTLSEIQALSIYQHLQISTKTAFDSVIPSMEWTEWNQLYEQFRLMLRKFRDLAMHKIVVIGEQEVEKKTRTGATILKRPELQGRKMPGEILKYFDIVGYLQESAKDGKHGRRLYIQKQNDSFNAKNRLKGAPPAYIDNPLMQDLYDLEVASQNAAQQPAPAKARPEAKPAGQGQGARTGGGGGAVRRPGGRVEQRRAVRRVGVG